MTITEAMSTPEWAHLVGGAGGFCPSCLAGAWGYSIQARPVLCGDVYVKHHNGPDCVIPLDPDDVRASLWRLVETRKAALALMGGDSPRGRGRTMDYLNDRNHK